MARAGEVESLMRGSLRIGELMHEVLAKDTGLRTGRRLSHVFARDIPTYPKLLFITDTVINIDPDLEDKRDIVQNAIDLAIVLGIENPKVAILSAVETVTPKIRSTIEAAALCKMAECRQITGGLVGGPLAFDTAVSEEAAKSKNIVSPIAGKADILVVPDLESGNMLIKQLESLAEAQSAGIVLGGRVPIVLTRPEDSSLSRIASCAIALLLVRHKRGAKP
jgi:phosphate acetyltransferase/phosphate butyryltransferase